MAGSMYPQPEFSMRPMASSSPTTSERGEVMASPSKEDVVLAWLTMQQAVMLAYLGRSGMTAANPSQLEPARSEYDSLPYGTMLMAEDNVGTPMTNPTQDSYLVFNKATGRPHWEALPAALKGE